MADYQGQRTTTMDQRAKLLYDHWRTVRGGNRAPFRNDINPAAFREILDSVFVLDWNSTSDVRFRLAGSRLCDSFGMELRGMNLLALWQGEARARLGQLLHRVVTEPCVGHAIGVQESESGYAADFEILLLPLKRDDGSLNRIIGCNILTRVKGRNTQSLPIATQWIDGVTVYEIPGVEGAHIAENSLTALQLPIAGRARVASSTRVPAFNEEKPIPRFQVIEGGLARKQG